MKSNSFDYYFTHVYLKSAWTDFNTCLVLNKNKTLCEIWMQFLGETWINYQPRILTAFENFQTNSAILFRDSALNVSILQQIISFEVLLLKGRFPKNLEIHGPLFAFFSKFSITIFCSSRFTIQINRCSSKGANKWKSFVLSLI